MKKPIEELRKKMKDEKIDAFLSMKPINRRYLSGFTGSTGYVVISRMYFPLQGNERIDRNLFIQLFRRILFLPLAHVYV